MSEKDEQFHSEVNKIDLSVLLHDFLRGFRKYWWIAVVLAVVLAAYSFADGLMNYRPMYKSEASFTITTGGAQSTGYNYSFYYDQSTVSQMEATFPYILDSDLLTDQILLELDRPYLNGSISARAVPGSNLFTLTVVSPSAEDALAILNATIEHYPDVARYVLGDIRFNMLDAPALAQAPYNSSSAMHGAVKGAVMGGAAGLAVILLYALTRRTIRREEEIKEHLNTQCVGAIPLVEFKKHTRKIDETISIHNSRVGDHFAESVRGIALRVRRQMEENEEKVLMVTATVAGEGCSVVARNMAYALAEMGKKVILLDADLRRVNRESGRLYAGHGLEDFLLENCRLTDVMLHNERAGIWTFGCSRPMTSGEIMQTTGNLRALMNWMKSVADYVVIDAPDSSQESILRMMAESADAAVYVIQQDFSKIARVMDGVETVSRYDLTLVGCVLNQVRSGFSGYGYGRYGKYYGGYAYKRYGGYGRYGRYGKYGYGYGYGTKKNDEKRVEKG